MELEQLLSFGLISMAFIVIPGPNILVIVSTSLKAGKVRGLQTVLGTSLAMIIQLIIAAIATGTFLLLLSEGLWWLKWLGVAYLIYLGCSYLNDCYRRHQKPSPSATGSFRRGFFVSLTNPKTILFFSAFLPQFASNEGSYLTQIAVLSLCFWLLATLLDSCYALLGGKLKWLLAGRDTQQLQDGISGSLYLVGGGILAASGEHALGGL